MGKKLIGYAKGAVRWIRSSLGNYCTRSTYFQSRRWNKVYEKEDPWQYKTNADDIKRKEIIIELARSYSPKQGYERALDIGAGEGWITTDLPAREIYGYDASAIAMSRFPSNVRPLSRRRVKGSFDLVIATGILYKDYGCDWVVGKINQCASSVVITAAKKELECGIEKIQLEQIHRVEFRHRQGVQVVRVFKRKGTVSAVKVV